MQDAFEDPVLQQYVASVRADHGPLTLTAADDPFRRLVTSIV
ncbi:MAG: DNA-3-methyladenine glycosylase 2 family protein, partial [Bacteroidetes bacterium]|nr:DNA-3-methyladenine glycosylase 2 family protein [Bacteroidota bacterium]